MGSRTDGEQLTKGQLWTEDIVQFVGLEAFSERTCGFACCKAFFSCLLSFTSLCTHGESEMRVPNGPGKRREIYKRWGSFKTLDSFRLPTPKTINRNAWQESKGDSSLHVWVLLSRREVAEAYEGFCTSLAPFHCARTPWHYGKAGIEGGLRVGNFCCRGCYWPDKISEMPL